MSTIETTSDSRIALPRDLARRLFAFRGRVWRIKLVEAFCVAACGLLAAYLALFLLDRYFETPRTVRAIVFALAVAACAAVPLAFHRWIWRHRGLDQVARLISRRFPSVGDQLLGIIELVRSAGAGEAVQSRRLCEAAIGQVAERAATYDFEQAVPRPRHRLWAALAAVPLLLAAVVAALAPEAAANAWARLLAPWRAIERFTFTRVEPLPEKLVVPHGEPTPFVVALRDDSRWRPSSATATVGRQRPLAAPLDDGRYAFTVPPQLSPSTLAVAAGDDRKRVRLEPMFRPEITTITAEIELPSYLDRPDTLVQDARSGSIVPVKGSSVTVVATASRDLAAATVDGKPVEPDGDRVRTGARTAEAESRVSIAWRDGHGLDGATPIEISIAPRDDEPPTLAISDFSTRSRVLLNTDTLRFKAAVHDDFGIRRVGLEWRGRGDGEQDDAAAERGDRLLHAGASDAESLEVTATFCPEKLGVRPQQIELRAFAEDFLPGRGRVYSAPMVLFVVDRTEHALLVNAQLANLRQQVSETRDREMALLAANKEFRELPPERLLDADTQAKLEAQAVAEEANAATLERLAEDGAELLREAMKNPEFDPQTLEDLSREILTLDEIASKRMPGVADLLRKAASAALATKEDGALKRAAKPGEGGQPANPESQPPKVGEDRSRPDEKPQGAGDSDGGEPKPRVPQVVDNESSLQPGSKDPTDGGKQPPGGGSGRLGLPTTRAGLEKEKPQEAPAADDPPADEAIEAAIAAQEALLAEFAKVAEELAAVMARLEGSTFVKRLKLASREQGTLGSRIAQLSAEAFGGQERQQAPLRKSLADLKGMSTRETEKVSALMDDLQAYFDRRQIPAFRAALEEMKALDALGSLRQLSDDIEKEAGMSLAQTEFWSDTFDRLADDLVPPRNGDGGGATGGGGGGKTPASVPPDVVLEAMKILDDEVNLREDTRVSGQRQKALAADEFADETRTLADRQHALAGRTTALVERLVQEPDGAAEFADEIKLFKEVDKVMQETAGILRAPDAGPQAIAAESEVIELLLPTMAGGGGGGGKGGGAGGAAAQAAGTTPGKGSTGSTSTLALALAGRGDASRREEGSGERDQSTGASGRSLPDEFRAGLDTYFNRFERARQ